MYENGIVLDQTVRDVYHAESGQVLKTLMQVTIYPRPPLIPLCVLTRGTYTDNVENVIDSYTLISGDTFEDWKKNWEEMDLIILKPMTDLKNGQRKK